MNQLDLKNEQDFTWALMVGEVDKIRREHGAYIWGFPIKWRGENNPSTVIKEKFGWEIEFENGFCTNVGYSEKCFDSYQEAIQAAIDYFRSNPTGDRNILSIYHD